MFIGPHPKFYILGRETQTIHRNQDNDNNTTVVTSNCSTSHHENAIQVALTHAVANTGATAIFIRDGIPMHNKWLTDKPIHISLPDGRKVE